MKSKRLFLKKIKLSKPTKGLFSSLCLLLIETKTRTLSIILNQTLKDTQPLTKKKCSLRHRIYLSFLKKELDGQSPKFINILLLSSQNFKKLGRRLPHLQSTTFINSQITQILVSTVEMILTSAFQKSTVEMILTSAFQKSTVEIILTSAFSNEFTMKLAKQLMLKYSIIFLIIKSKSKRFRLYKDDDRVQKTQGKRSSIL